MFLFSSLIGCFLSNNNNVMCDAMCDEHYTYGFSKALSSYSLKAYFTDPDGEQRSLEVIFNGEQVEAYSTNWEVSMVAEGDEIRINSPYGVIIEDFTFEINGTSLSPTFVESAESTLCGTTCTQRTSSLNTDSIEDLSPETLIIEELTCIYACATSTPLGDLNIVSHNDDYTQALIIQEIDGYDVPGCGYW